jgi:hypothetical protein
MPRLITVKDKVKKIRDFQNRYAIQCPDGSLQKIVATTIWTPEGRKKMCRNIRRRLRYMFMKNPDLNCSYQITLTYRDFCEYQKGDIRKFLNSFFQLFRKRKVKYKFFWVAEIQKRGMIHYHILVFINVRDRGKVWDCFDKRRIDRLWGRGYTFVTFSRQTLTKAVNYATKYLVKTIKYQDDEKVDMYLELVLFFREMAGRFRLYGMSQVLRFRRGVRKKMNMQYQKRNEEWQEIQQQYIQLLSFAPQLIQHLAVPRGMWVSRVGKRIPIYSDWVWYDSFWTELAAFETANVHLTEEEETDILDVIENF